MHPNRESWLVAAKDKLAPHFSEAGFTLPEKIRMSCGFPKGRRANGQCWATDYSDDGTYEIFVSPTEDEPECVLAILTHELCHTVAGIGEGHKGAFKQCARRVGLIGKMTQSNAGPELQAFLDGIADDLGEYPHASLNPTAATVKKQGTRMVKLACPCGYIIRTTRQWIEKGFPTCYCGEQFVEEASDGGD